MGLFNGYLKEGKGVEKGEKVKKPFFRFFELFFSKFWTIVYAGIITNALCLPLITTGIAEVGMSRISRTVSLNRPCFTTSDYFESVKKNWKQATIICVIDAIVLLIMYVSLTIVWGVREAFFFGNALFVVMCFFALFYIFSTHYHYMLLMTCNLKIKEIISNSFRLVGVGIKNNLIIGLGLAVIYGVIFLLFKNGSLTLQTITLVLVIIFYRPVRNYLISFNVFPVIRKNILDPYYEAHPNEDLEIRHDLGMYEYPEENENEPV